MTKELKKRLQEASTDGRIGCEEARLIAEALGVDYKEAGRMLDELDIKVSQCGLGCF